MKHKKRINAPLTVATLMGDGKPTAKKSTAKKWPAENGALEMLGVIYQQKDHQIRMSRGEIIFYLRDVRSYWSTPHISCHEIEELEQQNLIERSTTGICAIRLTEQGTRVKNGQQLKAA